MPGTTAITYGNSELSLNLSAQVKKINRMKDHPYKTVEDLKANWEKATGGERVIVRWTTDDHSRATRVQTGNEFFDTFAQPTLTPGYQGWGIVVQPVFISEVDEQKNSGEGALINLLKDRVDTVEKHFNRQWQQVTWRGAAASTATGGTWLGVPGWEDFLTLNGADSATGIIEATSNGTNTLHAISKASFPVTTHEQFHNFYFDCANSFNTNGLNQLYNSIVNQQLKEGDPNPSESMWYWSVAACGLAKRVLRAFEQYASDGTMDDGKRVAHMMYGGIKVRVTGELPNTGANTNSNPWSMVRVNWKDGVNFRVMSGWEGGFQPFVDLPGTVGARYALKRLWGQFIGLRPGACALLADAETF